MREICGMYVGAEKVPCGIIAHSGKRGQANENHGSDSNNPHAPLTVSLIHRVSLYQDKVACLE